MDQKYGANNTFKQGNQLSTSLLPISRASMPLLPLISSDAMPPPPTQIAPANSSLRQIASANRRLCSLPQQIATSARYLRWGVDAWTAGTATSPASALLDARTPAAVILLGRADAQDGGLVGRTDEPPNSHGIWIQEKREREGGRRRPRV
jgi:hypothetical protein